MMDEAFYRQALQRIDRFIALFAVGGVVLLGILYTPRDAVGFAVGTLLAFLSFALIKKMVNSLGPADAEGDNKPSIATSVSGLVFRYLVIGGTVFAMIKVTGMSPWPVFAGLATAVAAVLAEIVYELVTVSS